MKSALSLVTAAIGVMAFVAVTVEAQPRPQAGQARSGLTIDQEMMRPFNPQYLLGAWEIEWTPPDTGLIPGGMYTGTETVTHINHRYLQIDVQMEGEDGNTITGQGMLFYDWGLDGQSVVRYVAYDAGFSLLQYGPVGGDMGGYYSHFWETPAFDLDDHTFALKGRSIYVSPAAYRVNQQISIDGEAFFNFGIMWLRKVAAEPSGQ